MGEGRELAVSLLAGEHGEPAQTLPIVEAVPRDRHRYDFAARYEIGRTDFVCPAALEDELAERVRTIAQSAWEIGRASCREKCVRLCRSRWSPYH